MAAKFIKSIIKNPRSMGTIAPSSRWLAAEMASQVERFARVEVQNLKTLVVELGPGTGPITEHLVRNKTPNQKLITVDINEEFVEQLRKKFPEVECINASSEHLIPLIEARWEEHQFDRLVLISSLPLLSFPKATYRLCLSSFVNALSRYPHARLFQYSYGSSPPIVSDHLTCEQVAKVYLNFPPAKIWMYVSKTQSK